MTVRDKTTQHNIDIICITDKRKDGLQEPALHDNERDAIADLLQYLEGGSNCVHEFLARDQRPADPHTHSKPTELI